jgi:hypothetical protein
LDGRLLLPTPRSHQAKVKLQLLSTLTYCLFSAFFKVEKEGRGLPLKVEDVLVLDRFWRTLFAEWGTWLMVDRVVFGDTSKNRQGIHIGHGVQ